MTMPLALEFFLQYAYPIVFLWILAEQLGMPLPSIPILLTAGSLTATHRLSFPLILLFIIAGCFVSDSIWYLLGKRFGGSVVKLLCRLSLESSTCVRKTEDYFTKHGPQALLVAKFVPGLSTVAAPIAGQTGMRYALFLAYDLGGALFWGGSVTLAGRFFGDVLKRRPQAFTFVGHSAGVLILLAIIGFLVYRIWKQQSFLRQVNTSRLDPEDLKKMLDSGQPVFIVDLRHPLDYLPDPRVLPGALRISPDSLMQRSAEIPRDRDIVLYCTCPSEATAAKTAMKLRSLGIYRVRPLRGGFDLWKRLGFPLAEYDEEPASVA
jgi:membrane protein DedA with SNARE-associated domain/rhodanese-related sulfurtransferase